MTLSPAVRRRRRLLPAVAALVLLAALAVTLLSLGPAEPKGRDAGAAAARVHRKPLKGTGAPVPSPFTSARCFGAASRDTAHPCENPALRLVVTPPPATGARERNAVCVPEGQRGLLLPCAFGVPAAQARETIALIGDSHASHWRATLQRVAEARRWRGFSLTRSSCPLSRTPAVLPGPAGPQCVRWNGLVLGWLRAHPEVHVVFLSQHSGGAVRHPRGVRPLDAQIAGYRQTWRRLPASVRHVFVIRDTPRDTSRSAACIVRALRRHRPPGSACGVPRSFAVKPDPAVFAARTSGSPRVRLIDLTRYMCSPRLCPPVVGGALVHRDVDHLTQTFAVTLAPYLQRRIDAVLGTAAVPPAR